MSQLSIFDPLIRAPLFGSILMSLASSIVGVIAFVNRRSLVGEALSHAAYPGVVIAVLVASFLGMSNFSIPILLGGFVFSLLGLGCIEFFEKKLKIHSDASLCFVLSVFLGIGVLFASYIQRLYPLSYQKIQVFLYGQVATMNDSHIYLYGWLTLVVLVFTVIRFRELELSFFDKEFAESVGLKKKINEGISFFLVVLAIVIGIRSVGVVLMSGMLIAPATAARQFTHSFKKMFFLAGFFGICSAYLGTILSLKIPYWVEGSFSLPTGPLILLVASSFCIIGFFVSPKRGLVFRVIRIMQFRKKCVLENALKALWKEKSGINRKKLLNSYHFFPFFKSLLLFFLQGKGYAILVEDKVLLTNLGVKKAAKIVRLHRLWEVYLTEYLGFSERRVHKSAEEMEHILTPSIEKELTRILNNPSRDPHNSPIPELGDVL